MSCKEINISRFLNHEALIEQLWERNQFPYSKIIINIPENCFICCSAISFLSCWGEHQIDSGREIEFKGPRELLNYLSRMNLFNNLRIPYTESYTRHPSDGRFLPLQRIAKSEDVYDVTMKVCDLYARHVDSSSRLIDAFEWAICEVVDNVWTHSNTKIPGAVCAQYYPSNQRLHIGVYDFGDGIKKTISEGYYVKSHKNAVRMAIQRGRTRNLKIGAGNGLAGCVEILGRNEGSLYIWTGDTSCYIRNFNIAFLKKLPEMPGTGLYLVFKTDKSVDLSKTWIGESESMYLHQYCLKAERKESIKVTDECKATTVRAFAKPLSAKIRAILPKLEDDDAIVLDFSEVKSVSSSFVDELLAKLAEEIGLDEFQKKIITINMLEKIQGMANSCIEQRIYGVPKSLNYVYQREDDEFFWITEAKLKIREILNISEWNYCLKRIECRDDYYDEHGRYSTFDNYNAFLYYLVEKADEMFCAYVPFDGGKPVFESDSESWVVDILEESEYSKKLKRIGWI